MKKQMPFKQLDSMTQVHGNYVYCIGGCKSFFNPEKPENAIYDTTNDTWTPLPVIDFPGVYEESY